ncbi:MAG TPA: hypothetical protein VGM29_10320 [Polyangiaceae bacterium]
MQKQPSKKLEGEGSYTASRRYDANVRKYIASGASVKAASNARKAVEGPEGTQLKKAEQRGKAGPRRAR